MNNNNSLGFFGVNETKMCRLGFIFFLMIVGSQALGFTVVDQK